MDINTFVMVIVSVGIGWLCGRMMGYKEGSEDVYKWMQDIDRATNGAVIKAMRVWEEKANS